MPMEKWKLKGSWALFHHYCLPSLPKDFTVAKQATIHWLFDRCRRCTPREMFYRWPDPGEACKNIPRRSSNGNNFSYRARTVQKWRPIIFTLHFEQFVCTRRWCGCSGSRNFCPPEIVSFEFIEKIASPL